MIISISGKINSGKDTVAAIIQYLIWKNKVEKGEKTNLHYTFKDFTNSKFGGNTLSNWEIKKFADKVKDIVCLLLNCTREQLEDREFKEKELGEEWWYYKDKKGKIYSYLDYNGITKDKKLVLTTPRLLMQLVGTECGRQILHPNAWVVSTFIGFNNHSDNWIITDTRFPNELKAIKDRNGITIRVNRDQEQVLKDKGIHIPKHLLTPEHESETALDNAEFDYVIENNNTIEDLIEKVKEILIKEKVI